MQQPAGMASSASSDASGSAATEHFLVYGYKVVPCSKRYRHDWSVCPFAHTGEMAARRDPSRYIPIFCFHSKQRLPCPRGDECPYSHNLFEYWLHPKRYRTEMCQFGAACTRPVCFFAHGDHQLRHTDMPGGPQPVVAPPEPVPALNGGFGRDLSSPIDPAIKQQQQLMALQAAAAGFSHQQHQQQHHHQQQAAAINAAAGSMAANMDPLGGGLQHVASYPSMVDTSSGLGAGMNGGMNGHGMPMGGPGMGMGISPLQHTLGLPSSSPLSAPLPHLSPDMIAALHSMGGNQGGNSLGGGLVSHHSGIPAQYHNDLPMPGRLQRSLTEMPSVNAAAAAAAQANDNSSNLNELSKQLAFMQLMQGNGGDASGALPDLNAQSMDQFLGFAQLQQQQQAVAAAAAAAVTAGLDLGRLLPYSQAPDASLSCPLPPVFTNGGHPNGGMAGLQHLNAAGVGAGASCNLPRIPTAPNGSIFPTSPIGSDTGRDAPSPVGAHGRDTQVPAPAKKGHRWSAPASPSNSSKGGNDLTAADDVKLPGQGASLQRQPGSSSASSTSSAGGGSAGRLHSMPSDNLARGLSGVDISFSAGVGGERLLHAGSGSSTDAGSALLMVGDSPLDTAQVHAALLGQLDSSAQQQHHGQERSGMGKEKAAQLLAQLPEDAVQKLLALVQQGGSPQQQHA